MGAGSAVVLGGEEAARRRLDAQHVEERAGDEVPVHVVGLRADRQVDVGGVVGQNPREHRVLVAEVLEHGVRQRGQEVAVVVGRSREGAGAVEHDQPLGLVHREGPQHHLVHQGEDGGVRADAQGQGEHDDEGEAGALREGPKREAQVLSQLIHRVLRSARLGALAEVERAKGVPGGPWSEAVG